MGWFRSRTVIFFSILTVIFAENAQARWVSFSAGLPETDLMCVVCDPHNPKLIYAASEKRLYRKSQSKDGLWNMVFTAWGNDNKINSIYPDPAREGTVYVACASGLWRSRDWGRNWKYLYRGIEGESSAIHCAVLDSEDANEIWLGTASGLITVALDSNQVQKITGFSKTAVYSILMNVSGADPVTVLAADGVYQSFDRGVHWRRSLAYSDEDTPDGEETEKTGGAEEDAPVVNYPNLIYQPVLKNYVALTPRGVYKASLDSPSGSTQTDRWESLVPQAPAGRAARYLAGSPKTFYVATSRGVYQWDPRSSILKDLSWGLQSEDVRMLYYESGSDSILAATKKGVFRFFHPDLEIDFSGSSGGNKGLPEKPPFSNAADVINLFKNEPAIGEIQNAAVEYAEVHPQKIQQWREAASKKAWLPNVAIAQKFSHNQTIDIDRGGTGDPDRFIYGPEERDKDWSVGASWDLGDLVWSGDQTSIDVRSRLMVELRNDVLNEVTHLFYERRRIQIELLLNPPGNLMIEVEKKLRLEECTAGIDALTGGFLSSRIKKVAAA